MGRQVAQMNIDRDRIPYRAVETLYNMEAVQRRMQV